MIPFDTLCDGCGRALTRAPPGTVRTACPVCGSTVRRMIERVNEHLQTRPSMRAMARRPSLRSDQKRRWESYVGIERHRRSGALVRVERVVDRDSDRYVERVTDLTTGAVIHECVEPLTEHRGHGSAKRSKP